MTREHHERMDGSGYPAGLKGDAIHPVSRICAVVDSFDAMTAFRPFKERTLSIAEAIQILHRETPTKYDPDVMKAWRSLVERAEKERTSVPISEIVSAVHSSEEDANRRRHDRQQFHCSARVHVSEGDVQNETEATGLPIVAHSISRSGLGFLSQTPVPVGSSVRVYLEAKGMSDHPLEGQTVRCRMYNDNWYEIGMQFGAPVNSGVYEAELLAV